MKKDDSVLLMRGGRVIKAKVIGVLDRVGYADVEFQDGTRHLVPLIELQPFDGSQKELTAYFSERCVG
jgi:hypothetical protein